MKSKALITSAILFGFLLTGCDFVSFDDFSSLSSQTSSQTSTSDSSEQSSDSSEESSESSSIDDGHEHTFSTEWSYDEQKHWHDSTCGHDVHSQEGYHRFVSQGANEEGYQEKCTVCSYTRTRPHNYSDEWSYNGTHHWHACTDSGYTYLKQDYEEHHLVLVDAEVSGYIYECETCGYQSVIPHNFSEDWSVNPTHHWHACTDEGYQDLKADYGEHVFSTSTGVDCLIYTCNICGYSYEELYGESPIQSSKTIKTYYDLSSYQEMTVYFMKSNPEIPYVIFSDVYLPLYVDQLWGSANRSAFQLSQSKESDGVYKFHNYVGDLIIDTNNDTISVPNKYDFQMMLAVNTDSNNTSYLTSAWAQLGNIVRNHEASPIFLDCGNNNIDLVSYADTVYMPLETFNDIFLGANTMPFCYNGKDFYYAGDFGSNYLATDVEAGSLEEQYFNESPWLNTSSRSQALATFNYNELCFALDYYYGLKEFRSVNSFNELFESRGHRTNLLSTNTNTYENELVKFVGEWLNEGHSGFTRVSPAQMGNTNLYYTYRNGLNTNSKYTMLSNASSQLTALRNTAGKSAGVSFSSNNRTAVITFDHFAKLYNSAQYDGRGYDFYNNYDSELLFKNAFQEIVAKGSSVKNVVIDITLNGGGALNAIPWLLGYISDDPFIRLETGLTGEISEVHYKVDLNRDGTSGGTGDTYKGQYKFFLMTSNYSFSCGNAFPTIIKDGGMATIIGETSGGGACAVGCLATMTGSLLRMSSTFRFGYYVGGNFILNEDGITPDYTFARSKFYKDNEIDTFVNGL